MHHLLNEHGNFYELAEFKSKFNLNVPFTAFYGLIDAIANAWKYKIKQPFQIDNNTTNCNTTLSTSSIYYTILTSHFVPPTSQSKILRHGFTENNVQKVYLLPFKITKEVKIIMFQFKIIHNILPTQMSLYRDGFSENDRCPLCKNEIQTLNHLLATCIKTTSFWKTFQNWWYEKTHKTIRVNESKILCGFFEKKKNNSLAGPKLLTSTSEISHFLHKWSTR